MTEQERPWNGDGGAPDGSDTAVEDDRRSPTWRRVVLGSVLGAGVLAAMVGLVVVFVLGTGTTCACSPAGAQLDWEYDAENRTVRGVHDGGDTFDEDNTDRLVVTADGDRVDRIDLPFRAGDGFAVEGVDPGTTVRVVWYSPNSDVSSVIASVEVPGA